jgi:two-component system, sensor histidine kinase RegB
MILSKIGSFFSNKETANVAIPWLLALRWGEILCQMLLMVSVVLLMDIQVPILLVGLILLFEGGSNLYLHFRQKRNKPIFNQIIVIILLLDTVFLTLLLYVTGGVMNPFVFLYLLHIVLGAIILQEICSWLITITTLLCYGLLFYFPPPVVTDLSGPLQLGDLGGCHPIGGINGSFQLHLQGMWVAFVTTALFIVFFVSKIQKALAAHRTTLLSLEKEKTRNEKLSSLATLAAGAAHELSTPLSTVAIVSNEMIYALKEQDSCVELLDDAYLIRKQVADCKEILYQMAAGAGEHLGEEIKRYSVKEVVAQILQEINIEQRRRIRVDIGSNIGAIRVPFRSMCRTVKGLLLNGFEASGSESEVAMHWFILGDKLCIKIVDSGAGIQEDNKQFVTTPFFTTKKSGLGLGLFLAKTLADQFRGTLEISSEFGQGTTVTLTLSLDLLSHKS